MSRLLLAYYGDDFTGSADVMEVLQWNGLRTVLFLEPPTTRELSQFEGLKAFGVAGWSRTMSPEEMNDELRDRLIGLRASNARFVHYKTCSTFDSSPEIGNIGRAIEIGREVFDAKSVPVVVGAPNLARYQAFGNLFARSGLDSEAFRLDRHPTMRSHPITPMDEADLRIHLAAQTDLSIGLHDVLHLEAEDEPATAEADVLLVDCVIHRHLARVGRLIDSLRRDEQSTFVVGSSGIEYALTEHWASTGTIDELRSHPPERPNFGPTDQLLVITGSCSPVNDRQIARAEAAGFRAIAIDTPKLADDALDDQEITRVVELAVDRLADGDDVILHSSRGPDDARVKQTTDALLKRGLDSLQVKLHSGRILGPKMGKILRQTLDRHPLARVGIAGGDTSGYLANALELTALEAIAPLAPGSPLCVAHSRNDFDGVEFFFKGGQVGRDDVWSTMKNGTEEIA